MNDANKLKDKDNSKAKKVVKVFREDKTELREHKFKKIQKISSRIHNNRELKEEVSGSKVQKIFHK